MWPLERHRLHVAPGRRPGIGIQLPLHGPRRPCGRDDRSRRRRCPCAARPGGVRTSWVSHANAFTSKRWNSDTRPAVHSRVVQVDRVDAELGRSYACRSSGTSTFWRRVECTSLTAGSSRSVAELGQVRAADPEAFERAVAPADLERAPGPPPSPSRRRRGRNPSPARRTRRRAGARPPSPAGRRCCLGER